MQDDYINLDLIAERKLLWRLEKIKGQIPLDRYLKIECILKHCISRHRIYFSEVEEICQLLEEAEELSEEEKKEQVQAKNLRKEMQKPEKQNNSVELWIFMNEWLQLRKHFMKKQQLYEKTVVQKWKRK